MKLNISVFDADAADPARQTIIIQDNMSHRQVVLARAIARLMGVTRKDVFRDDRRALTLAEILKLNETTGEVIRAKP